MCQNSGSGIYAFVLSIYFLMHLLNFMGVKKMANDVKAVLSAYPNYFEGKAAPSHQPD